MWLPHDARNDLLSAEKSTLVQLQDAGFVCDIVDKLSIDAGINETRKLIPNCYFRKGHTEKLVDHLSKYRKKWNTQLGKYTDPRHDEHSHSADAMRGMAVRYKEMKFAPLPKPDNKPVEAVKAFKDFAKSPRWSFRIFKS